MKTRIVGLALLLLGCSTVLHADPIAITSGQFSITSSLTGAGPMTLSSDRFNIGMFVFSSASPSGFCFTCIPGQNVDFTVRAGDFGGGAGTIDGVSYTGLEIGGHLDFQTTAITLPPVIPVGTVFDYDLPFSLSGLFVAIRRDREIINVPVIGQGRLALSLRGIIPDQNGMSTFVARDRSVFTFGSTLTPTPEPTTLLMMTAGVALTARRFRRRERDL